MNRQAAAYSPPSRRRGGRELKKMLRSILIKGADGVVVSSYRLSIPRVLVIGGLKQLPRLRQLRNGAISLWRSHPFFAKKGITLDRHVGQQPPRRRGIRGRPATLSIHPLLSTKCNSSQSPR
jgi:hypothetical protein